VFTSSIHLFNSQSFTLLTISPLPITRNSFHFIPILSHIIIPITILFLLLNKETNYPHNHSIHPGAPNNFFQTPFSILCNLFPFTRLPHCNPIGRNTLFQYTFRIIFLSYALVIAEKFLFPFSSSKSHPLPNISFSAPFLI